MRLRLQSAALGLGCLLGLPAAARSEAVTIEHRPVACVAAERFSALEARFAPAAAVARARAYFHAEGETAWYFVEMKPRAGAFRGVLPKAKKSLKRLSYYVEVTDRAMVTVRTEDYDAEVVADPGVCGGRLMAASVAGSASVPVGVVGSAAAPIPAGFSGVSAAGTAAAAGGGGLLKAGLIIGGLGAAGAAAVVASQAGSGGDGSGGCTGDRLSVLERSGTTLTLQWTFRQPSPEDCYTVDFLTGVSSCNQFPPHGNIREVRGTSVTLTGLSPVTAYHIHVHPLTGCPNVRGVMGTTNVVYVRTLATGAGAQPVSSSDYESCCGFGN